MRILVLLLCAAMPAFAQLSSVSTNMVEGLRSKTVRLIAYVNCTVVPEPGQTITNGVILVRDRQIVGVGSNLAIPEAADIRDLKGAWVYAGFTDPYVDAADITDQKAAPTASRRGRREDPTTPPQEGALHWNQAVRPERNATDGLRVDERTARTWNELGFTSAAVASHDGIFSGSAAAIVLAPGSASDITLANNVGQCLDTRKGSSATPYPGSLMGSIALIRQTFMDADWYGKAMAARTRPNADVPDVNLSLEALNEAVKSRRPFFTQSYNEHDILRWRQISNEVGVPMIYVASGKEYRRLESIAPFRPDLILTPRTVKVPDVRDPITARDVSLTDLIHWYWADDAPRLLDSAGCRVAFTMNGLKDRTSALKTIRTYVQRGLPKEKALAALTTAPASFAGISDKVGTIAPGKRADLVIVSDDLFSDKATIQAVVVGGDQHDVAMPTEVDVRGAWTLTSKALGDVSVKISGTASAPTATVKRDTLTMPATLTRTDLRITLTITDTSKKAVHRMTAPADSILMNGSLYVSDGSVLPFVMRRDSAFVPKAERAPEPPTARRSLPRMRPLGPFGLDSLPAQAEVVLKNATVWTCDSAGVLQNTDVKIAGGKIVAIGKGLVGATSIDCSGMHITPGIIDEHSHIAIDRGVNEGTHAVSTEVRIGDVVDPDDVNIYRQLAGGVTSTHLLHGSANPMGGQLQYIRMRWSADAEGLKFRNVAPTVKFALGENVKQSNWGDNFRSRYPQTRMGVEEIMRDAFQAAREYDRKRSAASIGGSPVRRDLQLDALVEILNGTRKIHCHSYKQTEILMLMRLAEEFGFRVHTFTHILEGYKVAKEMAAHGAMASSFSDWWAYKFEVYDAIPENPAIMHEQGVTVSINSDDAEMARRLNQEAGKSVSYGGVSEEDALRFVTINAARQMTADDQVGSITVGKDADVVVWSGDPLSNLSRVEHTFVEGRAMFSRALDQQLRTRDAALRTFLEQQALTSLAGGASASAPKRALHHEYHCDDLLDEMAGSEERD